MAATMPQLLYNELRQMCLTPCACVHAQNQVRTSLADNLKVELR